MEDNKLPLILSIVALLVAVIGIIIAALGLAQSGESSITINGLGGIADGNNAGSAAQRIADNDDDKVWLFSIGHYGVNTGYLDEATGTIKGYDVDVPNAVCRIAGKNCRFVEDIWLNCWDSQVGQSAKGGVGLMTGYYDACTGWLQSVDRLRTFGFTTPFTVEEPTAAFFVKTGNPDNFDPSDISGKVIGFVDGWVYDEHCLARDSNVRGTPVATENIRHFAHESEFIAAIIDGSVDAGFTFAPSFDGVAGIEQIGEHLAPCEVAGRSMMTRKDSKLSQWWNPAFEKLLKSPEYQLICNDLTEQHGHFSGSSTELCIKT